jgi:hypothetical protein
MCTENTAEELPHIGAFDLTIVQHQDKHAQKEQ